METPGGGGYGLTSKKQADENSDYQCLTRRSLKYRDSKSKKNQPIFTERGSVFEYRKAQESV